MKLLTTTNILLIIVIVIGVAILALSVKTFYKEGFQTSPTIVNALTPFSQKMTCDMYVKLLTHYENNPNITNVNVLISEIQTQYTSNNCDSVLANAPKSMDEFMSQTDLVAIQANSNLDAVASNI